MKRDLLTVALILIALGIVAAVIFTLATIGAESLRLLVFVGIGGALAIGLIVAGGWAGARILSAARPAQPEKQTIIRETRIVDNRQQQPVLYPLPAPQNGGAFPELLRAAYQAGQLRLGRGQQTPEEPAAHDARDDWTGDIQP